jgi:hypothetical protein
LHPKLAVIAISPLYQPDPFDLVRLVEVEVATAQQFDKANLLTIGEVNSLPVVRELPARGFVLYRAAILFEFGIALLTGDRLLAILKEP